MAGSVACGSKGAAPSLGLEQGVRPPVSRAVSLAPANRGVFAAVQGSIEAPSRLRHAPSPSFNGAGGLSPWGAVANTEIFRCLGASESSQFLAAGPSPPQWGTETEPVVPRNARAVLSRREGFAAGASLSCRSRWQTKHSLISSRELQPARTRVQRPARHHATRIFAQVVAPEGPKESVAAPAPAMSVSESPLPLAAPALLPANPEARITAAPLTSPTKLPSSIILAQTEEERRACAIMRAQLLYAYPLPPVNRAPDPRAPNRDADAITSVCSSLESRTNAEYTRDSTLKLLSLPVLSFLVYSTSEDVFCMAEQRQHELLQLSHPACKPLLVCPHFSISEPLTLSPTAPFQFGAPQQNAIGLATLDLQLPAYTGDMPLGPSDSMKKRKAQHQRQSGLTDKFSTWLTPSRPKTLGPTFGDMARAEGLGLSDFEEELQGSEVGPTGGYIFNLCVSQVFRRQGLARKLLTYVAAYAKEVQGLDCLRMHAECSNLAAVTLYKSLGFRAEYEETEQEAALLRRPRRVLFRLTF